MDDLSAVLDAVGMRAGGALGRRRPRPLGAVRRHLSRAGHRAGARRRGRRRAPRRSSPGAHEVFLDAIENNWGDGTLLSVFAPSQVGNRAFEEWWGRMQRSAVSPGMARQLMEMIGRRPICARSCRRSASRRWSLHQHRRPLHPGRASGARSPTLIPGARFIEYPGEDTYGWIDAPGRSTTSRSSSPAGARRRRGRPRARDGDVHRHRRLHRARLAARRRPLARPARRARRDRPRRSSSAGAGTEVKTIGDGFLATFDGPARAVRCAARDRRAGRARWGSRSAPACTPASASCVGDDVAGIAVHIGARVMASAGGRRGAGVEHGQGPRRRLGAALRGPRRRTRCAASPDEWHLYALDALSRGRRRYALER